MATYKPTRFSRMSVGWVSSTKSIVDKNAGDTGATFSVLGPYALTGAGTITGATGITGATTITGALAGTSTASFTGAITGLSTATIKGQATITGGLLSASGMTAASTFSVGGASTLDGAVTANSTASVSGQLTATGGVAVGGGANVVAISTATAAVSLGAINPLESSSVKTVGLSGATRGDYTGITLDSIYQDVAANRDITWCASSSSTAGEVNVWGVNSTLTAVTPTASTVVRLVRLNFASYL